MCIYHIGFPLIKYGIKFMNKINYLYLIAFLALFASTSVNAALNTEFDESDVLLHCERPPEADKYPEEVFNKIFPEITKRLQTYANKGKVLRAHYMGKLGQGFFVVVQGKNEEDAIANAKRIRQENLTTIYEATKDSKIGPQPDYCQMFSIGPVAVLPQ
ncbi:hypothetical protein Noc_2651 [Nitrosococcus oceani ATCC 19707]|uniref:Uncharacterized protein n=4 Tax=Chromatiaceae TaxID=1046 RepID=Q3J7U2_NITOC|nr:hypothetical protein Noc_2651 [Nitrosococcus oceani ATCC 19707]ADJ27431.1 conserved hypothetical protein [Nitrosococcus watsonii C-113]EDZ65390.1 hypothetical protein NOC27_2070 [Nitrosococcus oceani AFC27]KFI18426.1 hypothetical protein IB75_14085 [Nitrosococcus oceani C-27]